MKKKLIPIVVLFLLYSSIAFAVSMSFDGYGRGVRFAPKVVATTEEGGIVSSGNAMIGDVLSGKTFSNNDAAGLARAMINRGAVTITPASASQGIPAGYHNGSGLVSGDSDLAPENIKKTIEIFGIEGTYEGESSSESSGTIPLFKTGQTTVYRAGDNGTYQTGISNISPRFVDNDDGTFTDLQTSLMWIKDADGALGYTSAKTWNVVITGVTGLTYAGYDDWRVPNVNEAISLMEFGSAQCVWEELVPLLTVIATRTYWTNTTTPNASGVAYNVRLDYTALILTAAKTGTGSALAVRGGFQ